MEQELRDGYTIVLSNSQDKITGLALKSGTNGIMPKSISTEELKFMQLLPSIKEELQQENRLQIYYQGGEFFFQLGTVKTEGPYGERKYFEITREETSPFFLTGLTELEANAKIKKGTGSILRKAYRWKGDKYE